MADFELTIQSGAILKPWKDPVGPHGEPSRIRPYPGQPQPCWQGKVGTPIVMQALIDGAALPDGSLGGRLFTPFLAEGIGPALFSPAVPAWQGLFSSSVQFTPFAGGHYTLGMRRPDGGAALLHLDVAGA